MKVILDDVNGSDSTRYISSRTSAVKTLRAKSQGKSLVYGFSYFLMPWTGKQIMR